MNCPENKKKSKKSKNAKKSEEAAREFRADEHDSIQIDVLGSYIGMSYDGDEPEQDADDL